MTKTEKQTFSLSTLEKLLHIGASVLDEILLHKSSIEVTLRETTTPGLECYHVLTVEPHEATMFSDEELDEFVETMNYFRLEGKTITMPEVVKEEIKI